jgi:hypothetical protein
MKKFQTVKMQTHQLPMQLVQDNHLSEREYTIQFIDSTQEGKTELFGIALCGTGRYIMTTPENEADLLAMFDSAIDMLRPLPKTAREIAFRDYGKSVTFNRFA